MKQYDIFSNELVEDMINPEGNSNSKNKNLTQAKRIKNDEFYTLYEDIEKEVSHYKDYLKGKIVYCNVDTVESNFVKFFIDNFKEYGIKELYATGIDTKTGKGSYVYYSGSEYISHYIDDGSFEANLELLERVDVVITNPPFSLFRKFINILIQYDKKFLILGSINALTYREIFPLVRDNKIWLGYVFNKSLSFTQPDKTERKIHGICWFTNFPNARRNKKLKLTKEYNPEEYPMYDNYDAINVNKTKDIPRDYFGKMGVPISFLDKYNPEQFEIIGLGIANLGKSIGVKGYKPEYKKYRKSIQNKGAVDGDLYYIKDGIPVVPYARIIIQRKDNEQK